MASVVALLAAACGSSTDPSRSNARDNGDSSAFDECDWPMWGYTPERTFATECESEITAATADRLELDWFANTVDVVTATPAVVDDTVYVGDWTGRFYALDLDTGAERWTFDAPEHPTVYSGQIVSSAAVAHIEGEPHVVFGAGKTLYALAADSGEERWRHDVNPNGGHTDPSEIQTSPVVVEGMVLVGFDGHNAPGVRAGVRALDASTGEVVWDFDPDGGAEPLGCVGVWSSPAVDRERRLVVFGTANCPSSPDGWGELTEAIVAVDLDDGGLRWSFQPHEPNNNDFDFAGAPNLFTLEGEDVVGLGNKDGVYYVVDRDTGEPVWETQAAEVRVPRPNFSTGGFIGATAIADEMIVGGTAVGGPCPCLHGIGVDGEIVWQQDAAGPTFAAASIAGDVAFVGSTTDLTLRAVELATGEVVWSQVMNGGVAGGTVVTRDRVVAVSGIREPEVTGGSESAGVYGFVLGEGSVEDDAQTRGESLPPTTSAPPPAEMPTVAGDGRRCVEEACELSFLLKEPPPGTDPRLVMHIRPAPFRLEVRGEDLGDPEAWLRAGGEAAATGAVAYGVFVSVSDDQLTGALLCILDRAFDCVTEELPDPLDASYNRVSILAVADTPELPSPAEGFDRLVTTQEFDPPLVLGGEP
jgi:polyvinyl alcohol dehydrogenase (cytochrome)